MKSRTLTLEQQRLIIDNPNVNTATLVRFLGSTRDRVERYRYKNKLKGNWSYKATGIPFMSLLRTRDGICHHVNCKSRKIHSGSFAVAMENVDRLIYCLDNNNGKLPQSMNEYVFNNLRFGVRNEN